MAVTKNARAHYLLDHVVGPNLPEWFSGVFAVGFGLVLALMGNGALSMELYVGRIADWFHPVTQLFGLCLALNALLGLHALHHRQRWLRMFSAVFAMFGFLWVALFYVLVIPIPWPAVWIYVSHALLEGLVFLRLWHRLTDYW